MAETPVLERLTASDLFLLLWDDYGWSTGIGGLAILTAAADRNHCPDLEIFTRGACIALDDLAPSALVPAPCQVRAFRPRELADIAISEGGFDAPV